MLVKHFIKKLAEENLPELNRDLCIHGKSKYSECISCVKNCPEGVIKSENGIIIFDLNHCNRCGICKMVCPTQSIKLRSFGEGKILRSLEHYNEIVISCEQTEALNNVVVPCLNGLRIEFLAYLAIFHTNSVINLNISNCKTCKKNLTDDFIIQTYQCLVDLLSEISRENNINLVFEENEKNSKEKRVLDRRELLKLVQSTSIVNSKTLLSDLWYGEEKPLNYKLNLSKTLASMSNCSTLNQDNKIYGAFSVMESCNLCRFCVSICPNGAWKIEKHEQIYTLSHKSSLCSNCQICLQGCRSKSIIATDIIVKHLMVYQDKISKVSKLCSGCRQKFIASHNEDHLCEICLKRNDIKRSVNNQNFDLKGE